MLRDAEWRWCKWLPRYRKQPPTPYSHSSAKVWYSDRIPKRSYLELLLRAEEFFALGLESIGHGLEERVYQRILSGDLRQDVSDDEQQLMPEVLELQGGLSDDLAANVAPEEDDEQLMQELQESLEPCLDSESDYEDASEVPHNFLLFPTQCHPSRVQAFHSLNL